MDIKSYSKESIKTRMFERVAALWDIRHVENLDPVVKLLVESLASEIFKLSGEVTDIESRILEKLARAFTPAHMLSAFPAHAVVHARPAKGGATLDKDSEFIYKDPSLMKKYNLRRLIFSPTAPVRLLDAGVAHMAAAGRFYNVHPERGKDHVGNASRRDPVFNNTVWLGINGQPPARLDGTVFFFNFQFVEENTHYYDLLGRTRWYVGGKEIKVRAGFPQVRDDKDRTVFAEKFDEIRLLDAEVNDRYRNRFMHVSDEAAASAREPFPEELAGVFDPSFRNGYKDPILWIKIVFPPVFGEKILSNLTVTMNCVPVSNKFQRSVMQEVSAASAIVPLEKEDSEYFLAVSSVSDSYGKAYTRIRDNSEKAPTGSGTYTIRRGGCERFNSVDAREYLIRLIDLLRDESIAFSGMNKDLLEKNVNSLLDQLNVLENKLRLRHDNREDLSYLMLDYTEDRKVNISARYYLTNGEVANGIGVGASMPNTETLLADVASVSLMTVTRGGKQSPNVSRQMDMYKYMLQSHGSIYTNEDIASYCRSFFGDYFAGVEVARGYASGTRPGQGVVRTTDIIIHGVRTPSRDQREELARDITVSLAGKSPDEMNYRVIFK